jgi:hypothetical protein
MIWYLLVLSAGVGIATGIRRDALVTCLLAALTLLTSEAIALTNGNIGTMVRFRDWVVPLLVWLSALGMTRLVSIGWQRSDASEVELCR